MLSARKRVFPLSVDTNVNTTTTAGTAARGSPPPKSPLHGSRGAASPTSMAASLPPGLAPPDAGLSGFDRMLLLRQMNVTGAPTSSQGRRPPPPSSSSSSSAGSSNPYVHANVPEVSAAQNLRDRRAAEAKRRVDVQLMTAEDYTDKPEGAARLQRREEQAHMQEEELRMRCIVQAEKDEERARRMQAQREEEARMKEMYMERMRRERAEQEWLAKEKEAARRVALEAKMKALKEAADAQARAEYEARQRKLAAEAALEEERRLESMTMSQMLIEDALSQAWRVEWNEQEERRLRLLAEEARWQAYEAEQAQRLKEETLQRRAQQAQQYEQDRQRRLEIHRLQKERGKLAEQRKQGTTSALLAQSAAPAVASVAATPVGATDISAPTPTPSSAEVAVTPESPTVVKPPPLHTAQPAQVGNASVNERLPAATPSSVLVQSEAPTTLPARNTVGNTVVATAANADPSISPAVEIVTDPCAKGLDPFGQIVSVSDGSPAMQAALESGDLLLSFGGVSAATPNCLLAIADTIKKNVGKSIVLEVLRQRNDHEYERHVLTLCPRKWSGKGLLGCQLSPFKWPVAEPIPTVTASATAYTSEVAQAQDQNLPAQDASTEQTTYLVFNHVQPGGLAHRHGVCEGDLLMHCGTLALVDDLAVVAAYLKEHRPVEQVDLEIQRWVPEREMYMPLTIQLEPSTDNLGCSLTTFQAYYGDSATSSSGASALTLCAECYHTTLPTSVHAAAMSGHLDCLEALHYQSCNDGGTSIFDLRDEDGRTPLFYACFAQQSECVHFIIAAILETTTDTSVYADSYGDTPLHAAASVGCLEAIAILLESTFLSVDVTNASQMASVHIAPNVETLQLLVDTFGADLLVIDSEGRMPLGYACLRGDTASVEYLCAKHPDFVDYADATGNTPLHLAAWVGSLDVVEVLLPHLPSLALYLPNEEGMNAHDVATTNGFPHVADFLAQFMAPVEQDMELSTAYVEDSQAT